MTTISRPATAGRWSKDVESGPWFHPAIPLIPAAHGWTRHLDNFIERSASPSTHGKAPPAGTGGRAWHPIAGAAVWFVTVSPAPPARSVATPVELVQRRQ